MSQVRESDVIVVGAGIAGLVAAREVAKTGATVRVLEARDRVGGRTYTVPFGSHHIDLGAHWVGPTQPGVLALARELGLAIAPQFNTGTKVLALDGRRSTYRGSIPSVSPWALVDTQLALWALERHRRRVVLEDPMRTPDAAAWDGMTLETWTRRRLRTRAARGIFYTAIGCMFGAELREMSVLAFLTYLQAGGGLIMMSTIDGAAQQDYIVGGTQQISTRIAAALGRDGDGEPVVVLDAPARVIRQDDGGVTVATDRGTFRARYAVVAVPPPLAGRIAYDPPLSPTRDLLTQRMTMGSIMKCYVRYRTPFWRTRGMSGEIVANDGVIQAAFDSSPEDLSEGVLVVFNAGDAARHWSTRSREERRTAVLRSLVACLGPEAADAIDYLDFNWNDEPWSRGGPVGLMGPGALTSTGDALRAPEGRLHWAGTETALRWTGYMDGAVESGERAAREVVDRLRVAASASAATSAAPVRSVAARR